MTDLSTASTPPSITNIRTEILSQHARGLWSPQWKHPGKFTGAPLLSVLGTRQYRFWPVVEDPIFSFTRSNGDRITPGIMMTDGGSVPRVVWMIPDLDPWTYLWAFLIHDWLFETHHAGTNLGTFEDANLILAEAIWTEIDQHVAPGGWLEVEVIYRAVSSIFGRHVWDHGLSMPG